MRAIPLHTNSALRFSIVAGVLFAGALCLSGRSLGRAIAAPPAVHAAVEAPARKTGPVSLESRRHWFQFGRASWYGRDFQGQPTANGEAYDMNAMTCAHRSLPLGSLIRVTNLRNHRSIFVRVNDRGPVPVTRVVDLSYAAARTLGFSTRGTAKVRIDLVATRPTRSEIAQLNYPQVSSR
ncbi:MAG: septal ring lytic transglycosylase RlpA family protein [Acidobacteriaceae bacterium]